MFHAPPQLAGSVSANQLARNDPRSESLPCATHPSHWQSYIGSLLLGRGPQGSLHVYFCFLKCHLVRAHG